MNSKFSDRSAIIIKSCHPYFELILDKVVEIQDLTAISGYRDRAEQERLYTTNKSNLHYPHSKHNFLLDGTPYSLAIDIIPYFPKQVQQQRTLKTVWEDKELWLWFAGVVQTVAFSQGIKLRWGGDWNQNRDFNDKNWNDLAHFELA